MTSGALEERVSKRTFVIMMMVIVALAVALVIAHRPGGPASKVVHWLHSQH